MKHIKQIKISTFINKYCYLLKNGKNMECLKNEVLNVNYI